MKRKLDREGVEFIEDEMDMVDGDRQSNHKATTNRGGRKPGNESSGSMPKQTQINMGADNDNLKNPLSMILNIAKNNFKA